MTTLVLVLSDCAHVAEPVSNPVAASMPVDCLDLQGQKELFAGIELEAGEKAAALARCNIQRGAALKYGDGQASLARAAEGRLLWAIPVSGVGGVIVGAAITAIVEAVLRKPLPAAAQ